MPNPTSGPTPLDLIERWAQEAPGREALVCLEDAEGRTGTSLTYAELAAAVGIAAKAFVASGLKRTDTVAILPPASADGVVALCGAMSVCRTHPGNLLLSRTALDAQLARVSASILVTMPPHPALGLERRLAGLVDSSPALREVVDLGGGPLGTPWRGFLARAQTIETAPRLGVDDIAAVFNTGGTTGDPKLALLTSGNVMAGARMTAEGLALRSSDRFLSGLPLFHVGGVIDSMLAVFWVGAALILPTALGVRDSAVAAAIWRLVDRTSASVLALVPPRSRSRSRSVRSGGWGRLCACARS